MKDSIFNKTLLCISVCVISMILSLTVKSASALNNSQYKINWSTIDGGGRISTGGNYTLSDTIGQPDAGKMAGGDYILSGGFWAGGNTCWVDIPDLASFLNDWLKKESEVGHSLDGDLDDDGEVNIKDYSILCKYWMQFCPDNWPSW